MKSPFRWHFTSYPLDSIIYVCIVSGEQNSRTIENTQGRFIRKREIALKPYITHKKVTQNIQYTQTQFTVHVLNQSTVHVLIKL